MSDNLIPNESEPKSFTIKQCFDCPAFDVVNNGGFVNAGFCRIVDAQVVIDEIDDRCPFLKGEREVVKRVRVGG